MSSYATPYEPGTVAGNLYNQGIKNLVDFGNKYADNETISGMVAGTLADSFATQANTGSALAYNDAFLGSLANFQGGMENLKTGNLMKTMAAEGQIAGGLIDKQGDWQMKGIKETGDQARQNIGAKGTEDRRSIQATGTEQRLGIQATGVEQRLGIATTGTEERKGIRTTGEEQRLGMRTKGAEDRLTVGEAGRQERLNIGERTKQELRQRADARGAVRRGGARFFG